LHCCGFEDIGVAFAGRVAGFHDQFANNRVSNPVGQVGVVVDVWLRQEAQRDADARRRKRLRRNVRWEFA
jgi:hypothetical protein